MEYQHDLFELKPTLHDNISMTGDLANQDLATLYVRM